MFYCFFFFFQAEDGIRDKLVTGVQTCALPILAPGLVDMRVQLREPGEEHMETIASGAEAAAAGGVTSMVCLPNTNPIVDDVAAVEFIARRARETRRAKV